MLRMRDRFKRDTTTTHRCFACGLPILETAADGRQWLTHALPWCALFRSYVLEAQAKAPEAVELHTGLMQVAEPNPELVVVATGDTVEDVELVQRERPS